MRKIASFLAGVLLLAHMGYTQGEDQITTVMISSWSTPEQLSTLIDHANENGIVLNINNIDWHETKKKIEAIELSVQFLKENGTLRKKTYQNLKYNELTEGVIVFLQLGNGKNPTEILANNKQIFDAMRDILNPDTEKKNTVFTSFSESFDAKDETQVNNVAAELRSHFRANNELVYQIRKERDPGSIRYMYRYYYNGRQLDGSFGISELDMTCDASVKPDDDGVLSLFVNSDLKLTPFAVYEN